MRIKGGKTMPVVPRAPVPHLGRFIKGSRGQHATVRGEIDEDDFVLMAVHACDGLLRVGAVPQVDGVVLTPRRKEPEGGMDRTARLY